MQFEELAVQRKKSEDQASSPASSVCSSANSEWSGKLPEYQDYEKVLTDLYRWKERQAEYIPSVERGFEKSSLDNMQAVAIALGSPQDSYKVVHVAGTNGKGSTCLKTSAGLRQAGFRTGLFTSPHISCFRERIRIDGSMISEQDVVNLFNRVTQASVTL